MAKGKPTDSPFVFRLALNGRLAGYTVLMRELPLRQAAELVDMDQNDPGNVLRLAEMLDTYCVSHDLPIERLSDVGTSTATKILQAWISGSEDAAVPPADAAALPQT